MTGIHYVNGRYEAARDAMVNMEDRGYQFGDGIYEYLAFYNRRFLHPELHLKRLEYSLGELRIAMPMSKAALLLVMQEVITRNKKNDGGFYMQVTRGVASRNHPFPEKPVKPSLTMSISRAKTPKLSEVQQGVQLISHPDQRWARRDVKSVALVANTLAKQASVEAKVKEALLVQPDGTVTEGATSNFFIVDQAGTIVTHPANTCILGGVTRDVALKLARKAGMNVQEKAFSLADVFGAAEAFLTSTSINVLPVVKLDSQTIGNGKPSEVTQKLAALYLEHIRQETGKVLFS